MNFSHVSGYVVFNYDTERLGVEIVFVPPGDIGAVFDTETPQTQLGVESPVHLVVLGALWRMHYQLERQGRQKHHNIHPPMQ